MEAAKEEAGFLDKIRPPQLEEAGLEDCALPPDLIKEAFLKAATAVSSRVTSVLSSSDADLVGLHGADLIGSDISEAKEVVLSLN